MPIHFSMANIFLIHGMWSNPGVLELTAEVLKQAGHRVVCPTLPGHRAFTEDEPIEHQKQQAEEVRALSLEDYLQSLRNDFDQAAFQSPPIIIGHSMGGWLAQKLALEKEISGLALINSAGPFGVNHVAVSSAITTLHYWLRACFLIRAHRPSYWHARYGLFNHMSEENAQMLSSRLCYESGKSFYEIVLWFLDWKRGSLVSAKKVKEQMAQTPVAIFQGGKDRIVIASVARALLKRYEGAQHFFYSEGGHWLGYEEVSDDYHKDLLGWIERNSLRLDN